MVERDLVDQRQYAETVLRSLNVRPIRVNLVTGIVEVPKGKVGLIRKICNKMRWPFQVTALTSNS